MTNSEETLHNREDGEYEEVLLKILTIGSTDVLSPSDDISMMKRSARETLEKYCIGGIAV